MRKSHRQKYPHWFLCLIIACFGTGLYLSTLQNRFVYKDVDNVVNNSRIQELGNLPALFVYPFPSDSAIPHLYRPITELSYMLDYALWGLKPRGYHATNIFLQIICSLLVYALLWRITGRDVRAAFFASLLFAAHSIHTENVAWVSGRAVMLATVFFLAAFWFAISFRHRQRSGTLPRIHIVYIAAMVVCYVLSLLSYEGAIILPLILVLYDAVFFREELRGRAALRFRIFSVYVPLVIVVLIYAGIRAFVLSGAGGVTGGWAGLQKFPLIIRIYAKYFQLLLLPFRLTSLYNLQLEPHILPPLWMAIPIFIALIVACIVLARRLPALSFGLGFFIIAVLPALTLFHTQTVIAERTLYLASVGFCLALGATLAALTVQRGVFFDWGQNLAVLVVLLSLLGLYTLRTYTRNHDWQTDITLWSAEAQMHPQSPDALTNLGISHYGAGMTLPAEKNFRKAIELNPAHYIAYHDLARLLIDTRRPQKAKEVLCRAAARGTDSEGENYSNVAVMYRELGYPALAERFFKKAIEANPRNSTALSELGNLAFDKDKFTEAIDLFSRALEAKPGTLRPMLLSNRALAYSKLDKVNEAVGDLEEAIHLNPKLAQPYLLLAQLESRRQFPEKAIALLEEARKKVPNPPFEISFTLHQLYVIFNQPQKAFDVLYVYQKRVPQDARVHMAIGELCFDTYLKNTKDKGKLETAAVCFRNAVKLQPKNTKALLNLGKTALLMGQPAAAQKLWHRVLELEPHNTEAKTLLGKLKSKTDN